MNATEHRRLEAYLHDLASRLKITQWTVELDKDVLDPEDDALATIERPFGRKMAYVTVREDFFEATPEHQRHVALHEMLHLLHGESEQLVFESIHDFSGIGAAFAAAYRLLHEYDIDHLTGLLAETMPLPELPRPEPTKGDDEDGAQDVRSETSSQY